jgi:hypothetical protein
MKINQLLATTLLLSCASFAQGQKITQPEALKSIQDNKDAIQFNNKKITEDTSTLRSLWKATVEVRSGKKTAELTVTRTDNQTTKPFVVKGICYSPAPMNASNENGPALGDWYWDTLVNPSNPGDIWAYAWEVLWARDLDNLRALGINTIRVYSMLYKQIGINGEVPTAATYPGLPGFTHKKFLDLCWNNGKNPIYVIVGIPMPPDLFRKDVNTQAIQYYWEHVLEDTAKDLEKHPAVLGFTVGNEVDAPGYTWDKSSPNSAKVQYWWKQVEKYAQMVKTVAPNKLVGIANHDFPNIVQDSASYMATCTSLDFWGVNSYQTQTFDTVFGTTNFPGYNSVNGVALKPVILTEWGMPASGHHSANNPLSIYSDTTTDTNTANRVTQVLPNAYVHPLCAGVTYFEYCDEWWKQGGRPNIYTWYGGTPESAFPNGYWDDEGFGVYSIERAGYDGTNPIVRQLPPYFQWNSPYYNGPYQPDVQTERKPIADAIRNTYNAVPKP